MQMPVRLQPRPQPSLFFKWISPLLAIILTVAAGCLLFAGLGKDPLSSIHVFFMAPLESTRGCAEVALKMTPLLLCAAGLSVCFRANVWNIGAEGQLIFGAITGGWVALQCDPQWGCWFLVPVIAAGAIGGMFYASIVAYLRDRYNASEILVSLMLVYVAQLLLAYCVQGPLQDPEGMGFPQSAMFREGALLPVLIPGTRLNLGFAIATTLCVLGSALLSRMHMGFRFSVTGLAPKAARYAGFGSSSVIWGAMLVSGAAAGLAGVCEVTGPVGQLALSISPGYGFAAIIVAFVARLSPVGCIPAAFVVALFYLGGELGQTRLGLPSSITGVYQGMLLLFLLVTDVWVFYRVRWVGFGGRECSR